MVARTRTAVAGVWTDAASWSPAATPTSADDLTFTSTSAASTGGAGSCASLTLDASFTGTVSATIDFYGNLTYLGGNLTGAITAQGSLPCVINVPRSAVNSLATFTSLKIANTAISLSSNITVGTFNHFQGGFSTNNYTINCTDINFTAPSGSINLGSSALNISGTPDFSGSATLTAGTSTITLSALSGAITANLGAKTYYNFTLSNVANFYTLISGGALYFNLFTLAAGADVVFTDFGSDWTFNVLPVLSGTASNLSGLASGNPGTPVSLFFPSSSNYSYLNITDISVNIPQIAKQSIDGGGNSGWVFAANSSGSPQLDLCFKLGF